MTAKPDNPINDPLHQHVSAVRAYHTGLVSETQRHLHVLQAFERHIDVLRHPSRLPGEKLKAAHESWRHLRRLEQLKGPWRETYKDFRGSLRRVRTLLKQMVKRAERSRARA